MQNAVDYFLDLGGMVFVPIVLFFIALLFRLSILKSIRAAATVGVGLLGLDLVTSLIGDYLTPAVQSMVERFNLSLHVIDVGSGTSAGVAFSTEIGAFILPIAFGLNVLMLFVKATKTMNIDIFNYSHYALTGGFVYLITGSLIYGLIGAVIHAIFSLLIADLTADKVQKSTGIQGISITQGYATSTIPLYALMEAIYSKIPALKNKNVDTQFIQKKFGMIGDPVIIGFGLGVIISLLAGTSFQESSSLVIVVTGIMILFPRIIRIIVEGLQPIADAAKSYFDKRFRGRNLYIGMDSAVTLGHPTTISVGILMVPVTLFLAAALPGNQVLPLADLAFVPFFVTMATIMHKGDVIRTFISSVVNMTIVLYIATYFAPYFTNLAEKGGFEINEGGGGVSSLYVGNMFDFIIAQIMRPGLLSVIALIIITVLLVYLTYKKTKENKSI